MADTDEFEALSEGDTDILETLPDSKEDQGFDPYNNDRVRRAR